jgi:hypothetical protein
MIALRKTMFEHRKTLRGIRNSNASVLRDGFELRNSTAKPEIEVPKVNKFRAAATTIKVGQRLMQIAAEGVKDSEELSQAAKSGETTELPKLEQIRGRRQVR